jgi:hypothetical protein
MRRSQTTASFECTRGAPANSLKLRGFCRLPQGGGAQRLQGSVVRFSLVRKDRLATRCSIWAGIWCAQMEALIESLRREGLVDDGDNG